MAEAATRAFLPSSGVEAWHCTPVTVTLSHKVPFSATSISVPSAVPKSGTRTRSSGAIRSGRCSSTYSAPYLLPVSSSATTIRPKPRSGVRPCSTSSAAMREPATTACWLSSTPRPRIMSGSSASRVTVHGSLRHKPASPGGTTSKWPRTHTMRLLFPGTRTIMLGRLPEGTRSSSASSRSMSVRP